MENQLYHLTETCIPQVNFYFFFLYNYSLNSLSTIHQLLGPPKLALEGNKWVVEYQTGQIMIFE